MVASPRANTQKLPSLKTFWKTLCLRIEEWSINMEETEGLRVPRVRKGIFRPVILPERRRADLDLTEVVINLYAVGVSTRKISQF